MRQFGEGFQPVRDYETGQPIPNSPLISLTHGGNGTGIVYIQPLNPIPAPSNARSQTQDIDRRAAR